jgi:transcriptional regulator with XRE-family HTH domain
MKRAETRIDILMAERGYTTDIELANKMGWSKAVVSYRINKNANITMKTIEELADHFGVHIVEMFRPDKGNNCDRVEHVKF